MKIFIANTDSDMVSLHGGVHIFLFVILFLFITADSTSLYAAEESIKSKSALPGEPCQTKPLKSWTSQEKWVWKQVCEGKVANFNEAEGYGGNLYARKPEGWPENRILQPSFLETILLYEPYRSALTYKGVRIIGAWFKEPLDLSNATLAHEVWLTNSQFESDINLSRLKSSHLIILEGSKFNGQLDMDSLRVDSSLLMRHGEFAEVVLVSATVGGQLDMERSKFNGQLNMNSLQVEGHLLMRHGEFAEVVLVSATVGGQLDMERSKFNGQLNMDSLQVGSSLVMHRATVKTEARVMLVLAKIGANLDLSGSTLSYLDITGTLVRGEFRLIDTVWEKNAKLILRHTEVGVLRDSKAWPDYLELEGFTYDRLTEFMVDSTNEMVVRDVSWFKKWLEKQKSYSPQPYEQLANVLQKTGHKGKANGILYYGKERERSEATGLNRLWLTLLWIFIGYGYRIWYALVWVLLFVTIGACIFRRTEEAKRNKMPYGIAYSFDMLLPIIKLRECHYDIDLSGSPRYYFYFHKVMGYVLASFLIAGLSGLTK